MARDGSFRWTSTDGSDDMAYDVASGVGRHVEIVSAGPAASKARPNAFVSTGVPASGPDQRVAKPEPLGSMADFVTALARAGDPRITTTTVAGPFAAIGRSCRDRGESSLGSFLTMARGWGVTVMEPAGQGNDRQLAEEIGEVLQAAAETAEKMQEDARVEAARIRAEAEWQAREIIAQARRQAAERISGADTRLADLTQAEDRVMDRLAGLGQVLAEAMAALRDGSSDRAPSASSPASGTSADPAVADADAEADHPTAKVYFVEFPPAAPVDPAPALPSPDREADCHSGGHPRTPGVLTDSAGSSRFDTEEERSEWAPPADELPAWWTRGGAQG